MELVGDIKIGINCSGQDVKTDSEVDKGRVGREKMVMISFG